MRLRLSYFAHSTLRFARIYLRCWFTLRAGCRCLPVAHVLPRYGLRYRSTLLPTVPHLPFTALHGLIPLNAHTLTVAFPFTCVTGSVPFLRSRFIALTPPCMVAYTFTRLHLHHLVAPVTPFTCWLPFVTQFLQVTTLLHRTRCTGSTVTHTCTAYGSYAVHLRFHCTRLPATLYATVVLRFAFTDHTGCYFTACYHGYGLPYRLHLPLRVYVTRLRIWLRYPLRLFTTHGCRSRFTLHTLQRHTGGCVCSYTVTLVWLPGCWFLPTPAYVAVHGLRLRTRCSGLRLRTRHTVGSRCVTVTRLFYVDTHGYRYVCYTHVVPVGSHGWRLRLRLHALRLHHIRLHTRTGYILHTLRLRLPFPATRVTLPLRYHTRTVWLHLVTVLCVTVRVTVYVAVGSRLRTHVPVRLRTFVTGWRLHYRLRTFWLRLRLLVVTRFGTPRLQLVPFAVTVGFTLVWLRVLIHTLPRLRYVRLRVYGSYGYSWFARLVLYGYGSYAPAFAAHAVFTCTVGYTPHYAPHLRLVLRLRLLPALRFTAHTTPRFGSQLRLRLRYTLPLRFCVLALLQHMVGLHVRYCCCRLRCTFRGLVHATVTFTAHAARLHYTFYTAVGLQFCGSTVTRFTPLHVGFTGYSWVSYCWLFTGYTAFTCCAFTYVLHTTHRFTVARTVLRFAAY